MYENEKRVLEKTIIDKKDNLILLNVDLFHFKKLNEGVKEKLETYNKEMENERNKPKAFKDKERIIELENKIRNLNMNIQEEQKMMMIIKQAEKLIETLKILCVNPEKIYGKEN